MSRVQKGGTIFRPVAKPRARPAVTPAPAPAPAVDLDPDATQVAGLSQPGTQSTQVSKEPVEDEEPEAKKQKQAQTHTPLVEPAYQPPPPIVHAPPKPRVAPIVPPTIAAKPPMLTPASKPPVLAPAAPKPNVMGPPRLPPAVPKLFAPSQAKMVVGEDEDMDAEADADVDEEVPKGKGKGKAKPKAKKVVDEDEDAEVEDEVKVAAPKGKAKTKPKPKPRAKKVEKFTAVVGDEDEDEEMEDVETTPKVKPKAKKKAAPAKKRALARKKKASVAVEDEDVDMDGPTQVEESTVPPASRRSSRARKLIAPVVHDPEEEVDEDAEGDEDEDVVDDETFEDEKALKVTKRKRKVVSEDEGDEIEEEEDDDEETPPPKKKRARKAKPKIALAEVEEKPKRGRKKMTPTVPAYDVDAEPGEELDPTVMTMAQLCEDLGTGRVSSKAAQIQDNHTAWKANNRKKRALMKHKAELKKYGREEEDENGNPIVSAVAPAPVSAEAGPSKPRRAAAADEEEEFVPDEIDEDAGPVDPDAFDYNQNLATNKFSVRVRIGPNGETIIDEESLVVDRDDEIDEADYTHIEESDTTKFVNSGTYGKKPSGSRWSVVETELFYDALSQFGENYELISLIMPGRDRKSCKNKFKAEDKRNSNRITQCLNNKTPFDMVTLTRLTGKDFSGPVPIIRAPTPVVLGDEAGGEGTAGPSAPTTPAKKSRKKSKTSALSLGEEVLGDADTFDPEFDEEK